jgi:hypothetical protein
MLVGLALAVLAADPNVPHPHQGVLPAYSGAPPVPSLTSDDLATLESGKPVLKQSKTDEGSGKGVAVQDIHASADTIWSKITSYSNYPTWVDGVYECEVYGQSTGIYDVRFVIGAMMIKEEYYVHHTYKPADGYMTWHLDYSRQSDLDDTVGFWRVMPLDDKPGWTRVYYSVQVKVGGWVPGWVEDSLSKSGLTKATEWVKRESEK